MPDDDGPGPDLTTRLGYLLKHASMRLEEVHRELLAPFDLDARELGVLILIGAREPGSQGEAARRIGVDRTTMVALIDTLESKGLVARHPSDSDRRRNVVELTRRGRTVTAKARQASDEAEARVLDSLGDREAARLRGALQKIVSAHPE